MIIVALLIHADAKGLNLHNHMFYLQRVVFFLFFCQHIATLIAINDNRDDWLILKALKEVLSAFRILLITVTWHNTGTDDLLMIFYKEIHYCIYANVTAITV